MKLFEMEGFLRGKCLPGDMMVNETNAEYLVRKISCFQAQVKQLAAENAALKLWASQSVELWDAGCDMDGHMRDLPLSVSTDAILASLRAEGVEMYAQHLKGKYEGIEYSLIGEYYTDGEEDRISDQGEIECAIEFAAQLRSKSEVQHD